MSKLEELSRRTTRRTKIQESLLMILVSGGRKGGDQLIKQAIDALLDTDFSISQPRRKEIVQTAASRLVKNGLLKYENKHYSATSQGEKLLREWQMSNYQIKTPRKWDKQWRVIIFDIPEKKRVLRDKVRDILFQTGFKRLQDSVWVYPYDCEKLIGLMKTDLGIGKYLLYMIVDQIENDRFLRMDFGLIS